VIDDAVRARVAACVAYAQAHPINLGEVLRRLKPGAAPVGDDPAREVNIDFGVRCVFSIEQAKKEENGSYSWIRHLSISVDASGSLVNPMAAMEIMKLFGFQHGLLSGQVHVYKEDTGNGYAMNMMEVCPPPEHNDDSDL
jgi:hypothetical protein